MFVYFAFFAGWNAASDRVPLNETTHYLTLIYITAYMMISPLTQSAYSDNFRAAWLWDAHPLPSPAALRYGRVMAVIGRFFLPVAGVVTVALLAIWGWGVLVHALLGFAVLILLTTSYQLMDDSLPFSQEIKQGNSSNLMAVFGTMALCGVLGFIHYLAVDRWYFLYPLLGIMLTITGFSIYALRKND